jgi:hypothetical protein
MRNTDASEFILSPRILIEINCTNSVTMLPILHFSIENSNQQPAIADIVQAGAKFMRR